jgi:diamine N-acetyltransferase
MAHPAGISLVPITADNWRATLEVRVQPERLQWVASREPVALMLLAKSYIRPDGQVWHPLAVMSEGIVVGIVGVGVDESDAQTAWVHHFLIDERSQGRGYGRAAMRAIGDWLKAEHPTVTLVGLNVLPENEVAFALYRSLGFEVIGVTLDGQLITAARVDELHVLTV